MGNLYRKTALLQKHISEIRKEEPLTWEEKKSLFERIKSGDQKALEKIIKPYLGYVINAAKQYHIKGMSLPDLISEGNLGLIIAAQKFDATKGVKFIAYTVWWIQQYIIRAITEQSMPVELPLYISIILYKISKEIPRLEQVYQRLPSSDEIADALDMPEEKIAEALELPTQYISIDALPLQEEDYSFLDVYINNDSPSPDSGLMYESLSIDIKRSLATLTARERDVINLYFGIDTTHEHSLKEIATKFKITSERIRQIKEKAIKRLKYTTRSKILRKYL